MCMARLALAPAPAASSLLPGRRQVDALMMHLRMVACPRKTAACAHIYASCCACREELDRVVGNAATGQKPGGS
jgi:hypothetical protein